MYSYFNPNPNGRNVSDCTVRAICKATGKDWGEVYLALCIQGYLDGDLPNANACWGAYLRKLGYRRQDRKFIPVQLRKGNAKVPCNFIPRSFPRNHFAIHPVFYG